MDTASTTIETLNPIKIEAVEKIGRNGEIVFISRDSELTLLTPEERFQLGFDSSFKSAVRNYMLVRNFIRRFFPSVILKPKEIQVWSENLIMVRFEHGSKIINCDLRHFTTI